MAFVIRNVLAKDYSALRALAQELHSVNLPSHGPDLKNMIGRSQQSFAGVAPPNRAQFLFVMEDTERNRVMGASKVFARHGTPERPHVYFEVMQDRVYSKTLQVSFLRKFYRLKKDTRGYSEIGGLVLKPGYRGHPARLGKQLSWIRFLFMKVHPGWFRRRVIAELLPPLHGGEHSTLYEFYGHPLTRIPYRKADRISYRNKEFILKLFPKSDLYFDILPPQVQADIEQTGKGARAAEKMLQQIGFRYAKQVDPFDGGPYYVAMRNRIKVYQRTQAVKTVEFRERPRAKEMLVLREGKTGIRASVLSAQVRGKKLTLTPAAEQILQIHLGDRVWVHPFP